MFYDTFQEHCDYEMNARYDYVSEAFGDMARDCDAMAAADDAYEAQMFAEEVAALGPYVYASEFTREIFISELVDGKVVQRRVAPAVDYDTAGFDDDCPF
jgi:hypothetical protein